MSKESKHQTVLEELEALSLEELRTALSDEERIIGFINRHYSEKGGHKARSDFHRAHRKQGIPTI